MRLSLLAVFSFSLSLLAACDKPCPKGQQRYGVKCVMRLLPEGGMDAEEDGGSNGAASNTQDDGGLSSCIPPKCHPCELAPCQNAGVCSETDTGFECACKVGFSGKICAVDACELDPCVHGECTRKVSGRECKCEPGYVGDACEANTNATLASLTVSAGKLHPAFSPNVYAYTVDLGIGEPEIAVTPTAFVPDGVTLAIDGAIHASGDPSALFGLELNASRGVQITIEADNGTQATYGVTLRRSLTQQSYVKKNDFAGTQRQFGGSEVGALESTIAIDGNFMAVGRPSDTGVVEIFARDGGAWGARYAIGAGQWSTANTEFGATVRLSRDWLVVAAPAESSNTGAVYAIRRSTLASLNPEVHRLVSSSAAPGQQFGRTIAAAGNMIVVGSSDESATRDGVIKDYAGAAVQRTFSSSTVLVGGRLRASPLPLLGKATALA